MKSLFGMALVSFLLVTQCFAQAISVNGDRSPDQLSIHRGAAVQAHKLRSRGRIPGR